MAEKPTLEEIAKSLVETAEAVLAEQSERLPEFDIGEIIAGPGGELVANITLRGSLAEAYRRNTEDRVKIDWQDVTSYSRDDKDRTPRVWMAYFAGDELRVSVHRRSQCECWFVSSHCLNIRDLELVSAEVEEAKAEAIRIVRAKLQRWKEALDG